MHITRNTGLLLLLSGMATFSPAPCSAQNVDYGGLEELFGEPVTTSATGKPQRVSDAPIDMEIISSEEIKRSGAMDIPQILQRVAGMEVSRNFRGETDVNVRGYNQLLSNRLLVLINGRQVYQDSFGMTYWNSFPIQLAEIKQIEVIKGPNSSLFGFNAASGVVNIITFSPLDDDVSDATLRTGTQQHKELSALKTFKNDQIGLRVSGGIREADDFNRKDIPLFPTSDKASDSRNGSVDMAYSINEDTNIRIEAGINHNKDDIIIPLGYNDAAQINTKNIGINASKHTDTSGTWNLNIYSNETNLDSQDTNKFGGGAVDSFQNNLYVAKLTHIASPLPSHIFRTGAEARYSQIENGLVGTVNDRYSMNVYSLSEMWSWDITDTLALTNSARVDAWSTSRDGGYSQREPFLPLTKDATEVNHNELSFNSGLRYKFSPATSYRASVSRGLHIPSLIELGLSINSPFAENYGNPLLKPEENLTYEVGIDHKISNTPITVQSSLYQENIRNYVGVAIHPAGTTGGSLMDITFENMGDSTAYGWELGLKGHLLDKRLNWYSNYNYMLTQDSPDGGADHHINFEGSNAKHKVNLGASYSLNNWQFDTDIHYVSPTSYRLTVMDFANQHRDLKVDDYITVNGRIGYLIGDATTISLDGYNLVDKHRERPIWEMNGGAGPSAGANELGRAVLLSLHRKF